MKLIAAEATRCDLPFEEKLHQLRQKFPEGRGRLVSMSAQEYNQQFGIDNNFSPKHVKRAVQQMPRQAASNIDRWNPVLMQQALAVIPAIAEELCTFLRDINNNYFGDRVMSIMRLGRCTAVPKDEEGRAVRPITLSCYFSKLLGTAIWKHPDMRPSTSKYQFASGKPRGCEIVVHSLRRHRENGNAIIRIDISNAFGTACRDRLHQVLQRDPKVCPVVRNLFVALYGRSCPIAVYEPGGQTFRIFDMPTGVKQGDISSSYFFNRLMDEVVFDFRTVAMAGADRQSLVDIFAYMDDLSVVAHPTEAVRLAHLLTHTLRKWGFEPNIDKSKILMPEKTSQEMLQIAIDQRPSRQQLQHLYFGVAGSTTRVIPIEQQMDEVAAMLQPRPAQQQDGADQQQQQQQQQQREQELDRVIQQQLRFEVVLDGHFKILGANVTNDFVEFNRQQMRRNDKFFEILRRIDVHPHLAYTLLRLCGSPRISYYCSVTPPQHAAQVVREFQRQLTERARQIFQFQLTDAMLYLSEALGLPDYITNSAELYEYSQLHTFNQEQAKIANKPLLVHDLKSKDFQLTEGQRRHFQAQGSARWLVAASPLGKFPLCELSFQRAVAARCGTLTDRDAAAVLPFTCGCGQMFNTTASVVDHIFYCAHASGFTFASRHQVLKTEIAQVLRSAGIGVHVEPNFFTYQNHRPNDHHHRPDLVAYSISAGSFNDAVDPLTANMDDLRSGVVTDFCVCMQDGLPGDHAKKMERVKIQLHKEAVERDGYVFIPYVVEAHGTEAEGVVDFIRAVARFVPHYMQNRLKYSLSFITSVALAHARVSVISALKTKTEIFRYEECED